MESNDVITENNNLSELVNASIDTDSSSVLSMDTTISSNSTNSDNSFSSDSMESSTEYSSDSMSISSSDTNEDSSSDYIPDASSPSETWSTSVSDTTMDESSEEEPDTKKRKRDHLLFKKNPLDNFCIYSIKPKCPNDTNLYIGSTVNFNRRKFQHKKASTNKKGGTYYSILYRYIRKCGGWDNFVMEKILDFPCETKQEGLLKEKEYIIKYKATLNSIMPVSDFTERMNDI